MSLQHLLATMVRRLLVTVAQHPQQLRAIPRQIILIRAVPNRIMGSQATLSQVTFSRATVPLQEQVMPQSPRQVILQCLLVTTLVQLELMVTPSQATTAQSIPSTALAMPPSPNQGTVHQSPVIALVLVRRPIILSQVSQVQVTHPLILLVLVWQVTVMTLLILVLPVTLSQLTLNPVTQLPQSQLTDLLLLRVMKP